MKKLLSFLIILCCASQLCFSWEESLVGAVEQGDLFFVKDTINSASPSDLGLALCMATYAGNVAMVAIILEKRNFIGQADIEAARVSAESLGYTDIAELLR